MFYVQRDMGCSIYNVIWNNLCTMWHEMFHLCQLAWLNIMQQNIVLIMTCPQDSHLVTSPLASCALIPKGSVMSCVHLGQLCLSSTSSITVLANPLWHLTLLKHVWFQLTILFMNRFFSNVQVFRMSALFTLSVHSVIRTRQKNLSSKTPMFLFIACEMVRDLHLNVATGKMHELRIFTLVSVFVGVTP